MCILLSTVIDWKELGEGGHVKTKIKKLVKTWVHDEKINWNLLCAVFIKCMRWYKWNEIQSWGEYEYGKTFDIFPER